MAPDFLEGTRFGVLVGGFALGDTSKSFDGGDEVLDGFGNNGGWSHSVDKEPDEAENFGRRHVPGR